MKNKKIRLQEIEIYISLDAVTDAIFLDSDTCEELSKFLMVYLNDEHNISFDKIKDIKIGFGYKEDCNEKKI